jgi:hypothetical protein
MKRYQRVNLLNGTEQFDGTAYFLNKTVTEVTEIANNLPTTSNAETMLSFAIHDCYHVLWYYHFEISSPPPPVPVSFFIDNGINCAMQYFYGKWRNGFRNFSYETSCTEKESRLKTQWNHQFYRGSLFSLLKNDNESLLRISQWVDRDVLEIGAIHPFNDSSHAPVFYFSPLFFVFAQYFCNVPREKYATEIDSIVKGTRSATKTLLKIWESIYAKDSISFKKQMEQILNKHIQKSAKAKMKAPFMLTAYDIISHEATLMWNIALRSGMEMPEFPEEFMDKIITPQSIGFEK